MGKVMKREKYKELLCKQFSQLNKANERLMYSFQKARHINLDKKEFSQEDFEVLEAMSSRFARVTDILTQKIFRLVNLIDLEESDLSVIDRIEKAEKKGLIDSAMDFKNIRELRNEIAHEYTDDKYKEIFKDVIRYIPALNETVNRVEKYVKGLPDDSKKEI